MSTNINNYKKLYISSATNLIHSLELELATLQAGFDSDSMERFYRSAHSLKGESLAMGYQETGNLCKEIEYIAKVMIDKKIDIDKDLYVKISKSIEKLNESIKSIHDTDKEINLGSRIIILKTILNQIEKNSI